MLGYQQSSGRSSQSPPWRTAARTKAQLTLLWKEVSPEDGSPDMSVKIPQAAANGGSPAEDRLSDRDKCSPHQKAWSDDMAAKDKAQSKADSQSEIYDELPLHYPHEKEQQPGTRAQQKQHP
mgnify:CR=1 FL=1